MTQDKRKAVRYRSYFTCDDPKSVVECGEIRKCKTISCQKRLQQHSKVINEGGKKQGNENTTVVSSTCLAVIKEDKKQMGVERITREVCVGARKMNPVIREKGYQDDIAEDLLTDAIDFEESLIMFEKLKKEALSIMSKSRRKQKKMVDEGRFDGMLSGVNAMSAYRVGYVQDEEQNLGWQKPKKSSLELKKAVRESLLRQSVITNPIFEEDSNQRRVDCSQNPSTSLSLSSLMVRSSNFTVSDCSTSSLVSQKNKKRESNLMVKRMELKSAPLSPRCYREGDKLLNLSKPVYEMLSPRTRKPQVGAQELHKKQRTVEEILESLNFKGVLRSRPVNWTTSNALSSDVFPSRDRWIDERPPIVIMKPSRSSCLDPEEPSVSRFWLGEDAKPTCRRPSFDENIRTMKTAAFATPKPAVNLDPKPKKKQLVLRKGSKVEKVTPTTSKEVERKCEKSKEELCSRDQEKSSMPRTIKRKDSRFISKHQISGQQDVTSTSILDHKNQERSIISGPGRISRRSSLPDANREGQKKDKEVVYTEEIASISDYDTVLPTANGITFNCFPEANWSRTCETHIKDYEIDKQSYRSEADEAIKHHANTEARTGDMVLAGTPEHFYRYDDHHSCYSEAISASTSEHSSVSLTDCNGNPVCEVTLVTTHENGVAVQTGDTIPPIRTYSGTKPSNEKEFEMLEPCLTPRTKLKALLLSNPLFVTNLDVLFDIQVPPEIVPFLNDDAVADVKRARVLIDYANEIMLLERSQFTQAYLPQKWSFAAMPKKSHSLDHLLDEICKGIKKLRCYHRSICYDTFTSGNLYHKLHRDICFASGVWETGWRKMFSQDEIERVTGELDKAILGKLIEEVVSELLYR